MPTTRVVKKEPIEWWRCPIFEYGCELTLNKEWLDIVMMGLQEAQSILRSFDRYQAAWESEVSERLELTRFGGHLST